MVANPKELGAGGAGGIGTFRMADAVGTLMAGVVPGFRDARCEGPKATKIVEQLGHKRGYGPHVEGVRARGAGNVGAAIDVAGAPPSVGRHLVNEFAVDLVPVEQGVCGAFGAGCVTGDDRKVPALKWSWQFTSASQPLRPNTARIEFMTPTSRVTWPPDCET